MLDALSRSYVDGLLASVRPRGAIVHVSTVVFPFKRKDATPRSTYGEEIIWDEHLSRGNFFPGTNPYAFLQMDGAWDGGGPRLHSAALWGADTPHTYWLWRTSLVYAVTWLAGPT